MNIYLQDNEQATITETETGMIVRAALIGPIAEYSGPQIFECDELRVTKGAYQVIETKARILELAEAFFSGRWEVRGEQEDYNHNQRAVKSRQGMLFSWPVVNGEQLLIQAAIGHYATIMLRQEY